MNALNITISAKLYSKNPDETELGKRILSKSIALMDELGYEHLTFKKVAREIISTESGVYRYFQNKHQLLTYLINWYWGWLEVKMAQEFMLLNSPELVRCKWVKKSGSRSVGKMLVKCRIGTLFE